MTLNIHVASTGRAEGTKHVFLVAGSDRLLVAQVVVEEGSAARRVQYGC